MAKKYAWETDEQKKSSSKRYAWDDGTIANTVSADITNRVNTWLQNHSNYVTNHRNRYVGRKFNYEDTFRKDSKSWLDTVSKQADAFEAERQSILSYMDQYKGYLDEEWANSVRNALTTGSNAQKQIRDSATKDNEYWNSFGSDKELVKKYGSAEGVYQYAQRANGYRNKYSGMSNSELTKARVLAVGNAMKSMGDDSSYAKEEAEWLNSYVAGKEYDELLHLDETKANRQIDNSYQYLNDINNIAYWAMDVGLTPDNMDRYVPTTAEDEENFANYKAMVNRHGDLYKADKAVRANIADMEGRIKSSDHVKEQYKWMSVSDPGSENYDQNFDYYSKIGASKIDNPINSTGINKFLEEDEVSIYNYYLGKFGEEKADQYLDTLTDVLRYRQGNSWVEGVNDISFDVAGVDILTPVRQGIKGGIGLTAGVEQFGRGVGQLFSNEELDASSLMYANAEIANDLDGFNALAYQGTNVVGNMLPSIALSAATAGIGGAAGLSATAASSLGTLAGTGSMSLSAMGNAYVDGLNYGMNTGEARAYGTLVGIAEGALEYFMGGIPGLSKADDFVTAKIGTIKNGLLRSGSKIGWNVIQEIGEEELQNFLEPAFRAIFTGEYDAPTAEELIETAIVTALSTSGMSAADTKINDAHANRAMVKTGKDIMKREGGVDSLLEQADYLTGVTTGYDQKSLMKQTEKVYKKTESESKSKSKSTAREVGKLANAVRTTTDSQSHASFVQTLTSGENGFSKKDANRIADALVAHSNGRELTEDQVELLMSVKSNPAVQSIVESNSRKNIEKLRTLLEKANLEEPATYKSLTDRVGDEGRFGVSESGKAVIRATGEEIDVNNLEVATVGEGQITFKVGGREVSAGDIDFADDNQSFLVSAVSNIENITAKDATAIIHDVVDMSKPLGMQLNAIDEAYTRGYYGYSEADLKAGEFAKNLTDKQLMSAYELGKAARRDSDVEADAPIVKMRTAAEAKLTAEQKTAKQKARIESDDVEVYFMDGDKVVKFDEHTGKYDDKRKAAINTAKFLRKLGIGGKYYFFESYLSETLKDEDGNALRVYKDADGNEVEAPNGIYDNGSIYIDLNAGDAGQGTALFTMGHELTHFIKAQSKKQFKVLCDIVKEAFDKTDLSMHERVLEKQKFLEDKRGEEVSYDEAYEEVVADAMSTMLTDGSFYEKIMEIKVKDKGLFNTIKRFFEKLIAKFTKAYEELTPDQKDAQDIRAMKDMFDKIQTAFAEALVEASDNFHAAMESVVEENVEPISSDEIITDGAVVTDGNGEKHSLRSMKHDIAEGKMFEDLKNVCGWTNAQVNTLRTQLKDLVEYMIPFRDILDMNESYGREGRRFSPYKPNSDPLYKISMDFSTLCSKRLLTQYVIESLQLRENRPMSPEEQMAIRDMLNEYRKVEKGLQVACAMCYVEAARLKSPKQIQRWLDDPTPHLINYFALKNTEFNASVKEAQADFKESRGYDRNAPKKDMKPADVTALNKIGPKLRSQYQLSAEEQAIVERAKTLPNSTYLTAGNLATLSETDPVLYAAYTSFVRTATRSKSLETDEPYYYGDSTRDNGNGIIVSDSFIEAVNRENGMRFSSWSDWRIQHLLDYITAVIDNSVRGAAMHGYTKFGDEVRVLGKTGMMFNMSGVTGTQTGLNEDGSLNFSDTESIDVNEAIQLREEFPEHAGLQCIGVSNEHIIALLRSDIIDYVIPYHVSGLNAALRRMADIYGWKDYTGTQHASIDKSIKFENAVDKEHWHEEPVFSEFFVGYDTKMSGIEAMMASAEKYKQLCKDRGLTPKFNQFATEENYWKLLIDRKMINQQTGNLIRQKAVTPTFDFDTIKGVVDKYVQNYDAGLEARALNHIVENWDSIPQRIKDLKKQGSTKAKKTKNAVDTLANQTVAAQPKDGKFSYRGKNKDGIEVYETSQDIKKLSYKERQELFLDIMTNEYRGRTAKFVHNGQAYYATFDEKDVNKNIYGDKKSDKKGWKAKINVGADGDIFELVENAKYDGSKQEKGKKITAHRGVGSWDYFIKSVQIDGTVFDLLANVRRKADGDYVYSIQLTENKKIKASPPLGLLLKASSGVTNASGTRVTQPAPKVNSKNSTPHSDRGDGSSNRSLLANAFEGLSQNSDEYKMIQEYKGRIRLLNEQEAKLAKLNAEIREIRFTEGKYDAKKLKKLETEAESVAESINRQDRKLLDMEVSEPFRKVIEQERKKEAQKTKAHVKEIQQNKKLRAEQTELRHKIRKAVRDLDKLLNRGNKKTNVKEDMKDFVSKALEIADYLFTDHISNDELIRRGINPALIRGEREARLVKETEDIIAKLDASTDINQPGSKLTDEEFTKLDAKRKANEDKLRDLLTAQRNERLNTPVSKLFDDLVKAYASLKNSSQDAVKAAYNEELEKSLRAFVSDDAKVKILENMRVADMTTEELNWLYRAYTMVLTNVRNANKFHVKGMTETIDQKVGRIVSDFSGRKLPHKKLAIVVRNLSNKIGWDYEKLYYALDRIGSEAFTELIMNLANSENIVMADVIEAAAFRDEMVEKHGFNDWEINKKIDKEFLDNTGKKFKLTLGELMSLYAYSRREGACDHIEYGGFSFKDTPITENNSAASYKLSKEQCEAITNTLTKEQKAYVEDMQKFLSETMGAKGNEVSMMLYGIKMFGEKNYFPIHIDGRFMAQAQESQAKAAAGFGTMSNAGFTHAQNPNAKAPFVMEGFNEVWADHVNEMSRYHGAVPALEDIRRVMNRNSYSDAYTDSMSVKTVMENAFGKDAVDYFDNLYREANSGAITDKLQRVPKKLLSLFRKNSVAYKLSVLVQQPTSIIRAYAMIDKKYFGLKGFGTITSGVIKAVTDKLNWTKAHTNAYNEMLKYAPGVTMAKEIGGFDTHTGGSIRSYLLDTNKSLKQKWKTGTALEKGKAALDLVDNNPVANLPNLADKIAWIEIWSACKRETVATHKDLVPNSEEFMQAVGERFTEVIRATQVYDSIFAKSPLLKSKYIGVQYLVSFMNEPNTVANMAESAVRDAVRGDWKSGAKKAVVLVYAALAVGLVKSLVYAMHDDDEDETYAEKYIEALVGSLVSDFNPLSYIPIARDVSSALQGYDIERPDVAIIVDAIEALKATYDNANKDTENMTEAQLAELEEKKDEATWKVVGSVAAFLGIPVKNIRKDVMGIFNTVFNKTEMDTTKLSLTHAYEKALNDSKYFFLRDESKSKQDKLYEAIVAGDTTYVNRLKAGYKDEDAYNSAVRKALRENDPRIHEAALAYYNGNLAEYKRIFKEIRNDDKHNIIGFDNTMETVMSEVSAIKGGLEGKTESSAYNATDFVNAVLVGNADLAQTMKDDIISYKVDHGSTREEADESFSDSVATSTRKAFDSGLLDESGTEKMLLEYTDMDEEEAADKVSYWAFIKAHPEYRGDLSQSNVEKYHEFAEPADIPLDVFAQYVKGTSGIKSIRDEWGDEVKSAREQVLEVIDSLPLTWQQKDALYLAHEYAESKIWDVPW